VPDDRSSARLLKHRNITIIALFVGFGLALFLTLTNSWFGEFFSTALTLFFLGSGIFIARRIAWHHLFSRGNSTVYWAIILIWVVLPVAYFLSPLTSNLRHNAQLAHAFLSDPSCSSGAMRRLAKQPAVLDPTPATSNSANSICSLHWTRAIHGFERGYCLQLNDGRSPQYYCLPSFWQLDLLDRRRIHAGDMFVAQTAYGRPSAFLYSGRDVADYVLYPWGQIVRTKEHPDERFTLHLMGTFCKSSFICSSALGSPFAFSEASAARQLSPSLPQNLGSIPRNPL
jgi:hypothetical protein